jgi:hypothetical protein
VFKAFLAKVEARILERGGPSAEEEFKGWDIGPESVEEMARSDAETVEDPIRRKLRLIRVAHHG